MKFESLLARFKTLEVAESIAPMIDSESLRNGVVAWRAVEISCKDLSLECELERESEQWEWLWSNVNFSLNTFSIVSGCKGVQDAKYLFTRLKGLRLIYPDGTYNNFAASYLQAMIVAKLPKAKPKKG